MSRPRIFRDPIHQQIRFHRTDISGAIPTVAEADAREGWLLLKLINSQAFQRMRHIRQNGLTNLVFHGMEHSRFAHSMGVTYLAGMMYDTIVRNTGLPVDDHRRLAVRAAGLLHDVGHGPFSHAFEEAINALHPETDRWFKHEVMTDRIITEDSEIAGSLREVDPAFPEFVASYINKDRRKQDEDDWTHRLISSQLDADRIDYLLRDAKQAGLIGHGFDLPRLLDMLYATDDRVIVDRHATEAVEAFLVMLRHAYRAIYFHPAVRGATVLLISILQRAAYLHLQENDASVFPDGLGGRPDALRVAIELGEGTPVETYVRMGDYHVWHMVEEWSCHSDPILKDLSGRLLKRDRFRAVEAAPHQMGKTNKLIEQIANGATNALKMPITAAQAKEYYVILDEPIRLDYKRYNWAPKPGGRAQIDESIWLGRMDDPADQPSPIENEGDNPVFNAMKGEQYYPRVMYPQELAEVVEAAFSH